MSSSKKQASSTSIRLIRDLKNYLKTHQVSPEVLAKQISLSNMTIRRMLERKPNEPIPEKYWPLFDQLTATTIYSNPPSLPELAMDFDRVLEDLETSGSENANVEKVEKETRSKMDQASVGESLRHLILVLLESLSAAKAKANPKAHAIALGALIYFVNPLDLIPDALPAVGFLDDFAVLTIAVSAIAKISKSTR